MDVEDVARLGLPSGRPPQQQREFPIAASMVCQIVVHDEHVPTRLHEVLGDAGGGIGGYIGETRRLVVRRDHHDAVMKRTGGA